MSVETEIALLKREVGDMKQIHVRLDSAIEKIAEVSTSLHTIMAVHEEKLIRQEEALDEQEKKLTENIMELHSRITSNAKETHTAMGDMERRLVDQMNAHSKKKKNTFVRCVKNCRREWVFWRNGDVSSLVGQSS